MTCKLSCFVCAWCCAASANQREQVAADIRGRVEEEVLQELSGHETVDYIRRLEEECSKYRGNMQDMARKNKDITLALRSELLFDAFFDANAQNNGGCFSSACQSNTFSRNCLVETTIILFSNV